MKRGLIFCFGTFAAAMSVLLVDQDLSQWFAADAQTSLRVAARRITDIGLGEYWFGLALAVYVLSRWRSWDRYRAWAVQLFFGLLGSGILLQVFKICIGRQRPHKSETYDALVFHPFNLDWHFQSLPSGHTQVLFSVATSAALLWPRGSWFIFLLAAGLGFTRVMTLQHFLSDVIAGALLGYLGTLWVHDYLSRKSLKR